MPLAELARMVALIVAALLYILLTGSVVRLWWRYRGRSFAAGRESNYVWS